jgi:hypothetical protein
LDFGLEALDFGQWCSDVFDCQLPIAPARAGPTQSHWAVLWNGEIYLVILNISFSL